jgi:hypothetical protein
MNAPALRAMNSAPVGGTSNQGDIFAVSLAVVAGALAIAVLSCWFTLLPEYLPLGAGW